MKWNKLIENETNSQPREASPVRLLNSSRKTVTKEEGKTANLTLKSCEKLRDIPPSTLLQKITSTPEWNISEHSNRKSNSRQSNSRRTEISQVNRPHSTLQPSRNTLYQDQQQITKIIDSFSSELQSLVNKCVTRFEKINQNRETKDEFIRRLSQSIEETTNRCLTASEPVLMKAQTDSALGSHSIHSQVELKLPASTSDKIKNRAMRFKQQIVHQKNCFSKLEQSIEKSHSLLRDGNQPKFVRTSRISKRDRSSDSSIQEILQKSLHESQRTYRSKMKAKDSLYTANKILHQ